MSVSVLTYVSKFCSFIGSCGERKLSESRWSPAAAHKVYRSEEQSSPPVRVVLLQTGLLLFSLMST